MLCTAILAEICRMEKQIPTFSFWEKQWLKNTDILVIGAGIVGLQTARQLKLKWPHRQVWVIDRSALSLGASTRNAGFACFGSMGEILDDISRTDEVTALSLYEKRFRGLQLLLEDFGQTGIGYEKTGGYEIFNAGQEQELDRILGHLENVNEHLREITGEVPFIAKSTEKLGMRILNTGIYTPLEGTIQTHLLYHRIRSAAVASGVEIFGGLNALPPQQLDNGRWRISSKEGYEFDARMLVICTNGFTKDLLPEIPVEPARGQVLVTSPIPGLAWRGLMHADQGYIYFRSLGTRILIGGARNQNFSAENTDSFETTGEITGRLKQYLNEVVLPGENVEIEHEWAGTMGMNKDRSPVVREISPGLWVCVRMGGMGVALSALVSRELADMAEL